MPQVVVVVLLLLSFSEKLFYSTESFALFLVMCVFQLKQAFVVVCDASERKIQNLKEGKIPKKETKNKM